MLPHERTHRRTVRRMRREGKLGPRALTERSELWEVAEWALAAIAILALWLAILIGIVEAIRLLG